MLTMGSSPSRKLSSKALHLIIDYLSLKRLPLYHQDGRVTGWICHLKSSPSIYFSLYISAAEIPPAALRNIIHKSYSTFRVPSVTPTVTLDGDETIDLLELFPELTS